METTLTLRKRLGFNEVSLWKQFCARRLHLIHTLSLNLRKASEQDEQVRVLAAELCAEYGFTSSSQSDFEKLLIAGIQSVRRNQKRSSRNPPPSGISTQRTVSYPLSFAADAPRPPMYDPMKRTADQNGHSDGVKSQKRDSESSIASDHSSSTTPNQSSRPSQAVSPRQQLPPTPNSMHSDSQSGAMFDSHQAAALASTYEKSSAVHGGKYALFPPTPAPNAPHHETPMTQSLVVRLDVLRGMITAASATWIESSAPLLAQMSADGVLSTAVAAAAVHAKLDPSQCYEMRDSLMRGALLESLRLALDPRLTTTKLLERIGALAASLVHGPNLLSALQALFVSLAQAAHGSLEDMRYVLKPMALQDGYVVDPGVHQHPVYQYYRHPRPDQVGNPASADTSLDATINSRTASSSGTQRDSVASIQSLSHRNSETANPPINRSQSITQLANQPAQLANQPPPLSNQSAQLPNQPPPLANQPPPLANQPAQLPNQPAQLATSTTKRVSTSGPVLSPLSAPSLSHVSSMPCLPVAMSATAPPTPATPASTSTAANQTSRSPNNADISAQNLRSLLSLAPMPNGGFPPANQSPFGLPISMNPSTGLPLYPVPPGFMSLPMHMMPYPMQHPHSQTLPPAVPPAVQPVPAPSAGVPANSSAPASASTANPSAETTAPSNDGIVNPGPDRLVKIQYNDRVLQMTYSPLKATPPTISEIIDNARQSFAIPASTVVRVKYVQGDKIIESNAELIEAFNDREVQLELLVPPPLLLGLPRPETSAKFTPLAPIFRAST